MLRAIVVVACVLACARAFAAPERCDIGPAVPITAPTCGDLAPPTLSCSAPADVQGALAQPNGNTVQRAANLFSWQQFIALNWPADARHRGEPDAKASLTSPGPRVWETWKETDEVYRPDGARPAPWNDRQPFPAVCEGTHKLLVRQSKVSDVVDGILQALPAQAEPPAILRDQQGRPLRYEIRLNRTLFEHIVKERLYDGTVQAKAASIVFPDGSQLLKAAWRELDVGDDKYFVATDACVCDDAPDGQPVGCRVQRMGLAGFHLMSKTASAPQWIWSTFEQVDTVEPQHGAVMPLNNPACDAARCPPNMQTPDNVPTQLARVTPIPKRDPDCAQPQRSVDNVAALNGNLRTALARARTPLSNYQLIDTQWPLPSASSGTVFVARPTHLANTTMESFGQGTSTCMGCHAMARSLNPDNFVGADFSFTLNNALPRPRDARCENVEASESCDANLLPIPPRVPPHATMAYEVRRGYDIARRTYELLDGGSASSPVGNRLHCESCHLHAGADPEAAWWAGSETRMGGLQGLQTRINQCFEHSMNGAALCVPDSNGNTDCDTNTPMRSLVAYIRWLTDEYEKRHPGSQPIAGFPLLPAAPSPANVDRGAATFAQKCAFCHGAAGEGRYVAGYFRPALWGPMSYNAKAGLAQVQTLAAFLKANMPYTSGGLLSVQEAWDLATFIDTQPRPPGPASSSQEAGASPASESIADPTDSRAGPATPRQP